MALKIDTDKIHAKVPGMTADEIDALVAEVRAYDKATVADILLMPAMAPSAAHVVVAEALCDAEVARAAVKKFRATLAAKRSKFSA